MKKIICLLLVMVFVMSYSDQVSFSWTPQNTDTLTGVRYKADRNAQANVTNGNLDNDNLKADADISQSKINTSRGGWISDNVGRFTNATGYRELHSEKGWKVFSNDTTTYGNPIIFFSDSTDTILKISPESMYVTKFMHVKDSSYFGGIVRVNDSVIVKGFRATASIRGDSLISDKGIRAVADINGVDIIASSDLVATDSVGAGKGIRAIGNIKSDSGFIFPVLTGNIGSVVGRMALKNDTMQGFVDPDGGNPTNAFQVKIPLKNISGDSLIAGKGIRAIGSIRTSDSIVSTTGGRIANRLKADTLENPGKIIGNRADFNYSYSGLSDGDSATFNVGQFSTLNTGQGVNELYPMDQDVQTTAQVYHDSVGARRLTVSGKTQINLFGIGNSAGGGYNAVTLSNDSIPTASGAASFFVVTSEGGSGQDTLAYFPFDKIDWGTIVVIRPANGSTIVIKDGNDFECGSNFSLANTYDTAMFIYSGIKLGLIAKSTSN